MANIAVAVPSSDYKILNVEPRVFKDPVSSISYNGYIYSIGSWTTTTYAPFLQTNEGGISKTSISDVSDGLVTKIRSSDIGTSSLFNAKNLCRIGDMLYCTGSIDALWVLVQYNTLDDTYKIWKLINSQTYVVATDGTYIYRCSGTSVFKYLEADFRDSLWSQYNVDYDNAGAPITLLAEYNSFNKGGDIIDVTKKGTINSVLYDAGFLYIAFSSTDPSKLCELHKVDVTTMELDSWIYIPHSGNGGVAQNSTHIFLGVRLGTTGAWVDTIYGYYWSAVAIKKSNMVLTPLVRHGGTDIGPLIFSYGVSLFDTFLFIYKQDYTTYVASIADVDTWSDADPVGSHILDVINYDINGLRLNATNYQKKLNSIVLGPDATFISSMVTVSGDSDGDSAVMRFVVDPYTLVLPTISLLTADVVAADVTLSASVTSAEPILLSGIRWGYNVLDMTDIDSAIPTASISESLTDVATGIYYYQAYASNKYGETVSAISTFQILNNDKIPTIITKSPVQDNYTMTLNGMVQQPNGQPVTSAGFRYGVDQNNLNIEVEAIVQVDFSVDITVPTGLYYYQAYAVNSVGEGVSQISTFEVTKYLRIDIESGDIIAQIYTPPTIYAHYIHGSLLYNGYIYGSARNATVPATTDLGNIIKISCTDYNDISNIRFRITSDADNTVLDYLEQVCRVGTYLYALAATQTTNVHQVLVQVDTQDDSWKVFEMPHMQTVPIIADDEFIYVTDATYVHKYRASDFQNPTYPKYNTSVITVPLPEAVASFDHLSYGWIDPIYGNSSSKGRVHCGITDDTYLYLGWTTGSTDSPYEVQKVRKSDMVGTGWGFIPKATDDMCQTDTHLFFGYEIQNNAPIDTYGYGAGIFAVRKSDLNITMLPKYDQYDVIGTDQTDVTSYGVFVINGYLFDLKTNGYLYILDPSNVDNWLITDPVGTDVLHIVGFYRDGTRNKGYNPLNSPPSYDSTPNELLLDTTGTFHTFLYASNSGIQRFTIPGYDFLETTTTTTTTTVLSTTTTTTNVPITTTTTTTLPSADISPFISGRQNLRAFVRFDVTGRLIPGSLILAKKMPDTGKWKEINSRL